MNILLCGLPRAGKTTFGKQLAKSLRWHFLDTDALLAPIEELPSLYRRLGPVLFRQREQKILQSLEGKTQHVIALGGGALEIEENRPMLQGLGTICYLRTPLDLVLERMRKKSVPSFLRQENLEEELAALAAKRCPVYEEVADMVIDGE